MSEVVIFDKSKESIKVAKEYLKEKYKDAEIIDVSFSKIDNENGYDLLIRPKEGKPVKIEVKGSRKWGGIPDSFYTEFDKNRKLIADFLIIVYFINENPVIVELTKEQVNAYSDKHRIVSHIKFASALKTEIRRNPEKYIVNYLKRPKLYSLDDIRQIYANAYKEWTAEEDKILSEEYKSGKSFQELAISFKRKRSAIKSRLRKLGLIE